MFLKMYKCLLVLKHIYKERFSIHIVVIIILLCFVSIVL